MVIEDLLPVVWWTAMLAALIGLGGWVLPFVAASVPERLCRGLLLVGLAGLVAHLVRAGSSGKVLDSLLFALLATGLLLRWLALRGRGPEVVVARWLLARRPQLVDRLGGGERSEGRAGGLSLADLRAEYGQTILDDAARDPLLENLLDGIGEALLNTVRTLEAQMQDTPEVGSQPLTRYLILTELANRCLSEATASATIVPRPYAAGRRRMPAGREHSIAGRIGLEGVAQRWPATAGARAGVTRARAGRVPGIPAHTPTPTPARTDTIVAIRFARSHDTSARTTVRAATRTHVATITTRRVVIPQHAATSQRTARADDGAYPRGRLDECRNHAGNGGYADANDDPELRHPLVARIALYPRLLADEVEQRPKGLGVKFFTSAVLFRPRIASGGRASVETIRITAGLPGAWSTQCVPGVERVGVLWASGGVVDRAFTEQSRKPGQGNRDRRLVKPEIA